MGMTDISPDEVILWQWRFVTLNATIAWTWALMALMTLGAWWITRRLSTGQQMSRWQNLLEVIVEYARDQIHQISRQPARPYLPFIGSLFLFIALANALSIVPGYVPPTASLSTTAALAICVFLAVPIYGVMQRGFLGFLKHYIEPNIVMLPFNLISITDGQVYLSPRLFRQGVLPAVDVGRSVSRVGGRAQLPAYRAVAGDLRLAYSQFEELERFSRYGTRIDEQTRRTLEHGRRIREVFKQSQFGPLPVAEQIALLLAASEGLLDDLPPSHVADLQSAIAKAVEHELSHVAEAIEKGSQLDDEARGNLLRVARETISRRATHGS